MEYAPTNYPTMRSGQFDASDVELLEKVMTLDPDLAVIVDIVKRARQTLSYPIDSHDALSPLFGENVREYRFATRTVTIDEVQSSVPRSFFPIDSEEDLIQKAYLALKIGHRSHENKEMARSYHLAALLGDDEGSLIVRRPTASATTFSLE